MCKLIYANEKELAHDLNNFSHLCAKKNQTGFDLFTVMSQPIIFRLEA